DRADLPSGPGARPLVPAARGCRRAGTPGGPHALGTGAPGPDSAWDAAGAPPPGAPGGQVPGCRGAKRSVAPPAGRHDPSSGTGWTNSLPLWERAGWGLLVLGVCALPAIVHPAHRHFQVCERLADRPVRV